MFTTAKNAIKSTFEIIVTMRQFIKAATALQSLQKSETALHTALSSTYESKYRAQTTLRVHSVSYNVNTENLEES